MYFVYSKTQLQSIFLFWSKNSLNSRQVLLLCSLNFVFKTELTVETNDMQNKSKSIFFEERMTYKWSSWNLLFQHVAASTGTGENDLKKLKDILDRVPDIKYICVDVANGYSEHFVQFVKSCRREFPKQTIMVCVRSVN